MGSWTGSMGSVHGFMKAGVILGRWIGDGHVRLD